MSKKNERMKKEAVKRLKMLGVMNSVIEDFTNGILNASEQGIIPGALYHLTDEEKELVKNIEKEYGGLVYHCIRCRTEFGELLNMLWVTKYEEVWEIENESLGEGFVFSYVKNLSSPLCSEFGTITVASINGGLIRVG